MTTTRQTAEELDCTTNLREIGRKGATEGRRERGRGEGEGGRGGGEKEGGREVREEGN